jgi:23S rRNA (guanine745-N1)-methyltransferase
MPVPQALATLAERLRCPHCGAALVPADGTLVCAAGHSYDIARQGYVSLPRPGRQVHPGDSAEMVAAREAFLGAGHYEPIARAVSAVAGRPRVAVDLGAGTGYYLAALLDGHDDAWGLAIDASRPALRRAARAHPRMAAVACDVWQPLPVADAAADLVIDVFAPRNAPEIARILAPHGTLVVVTPTQDHLREIVPLLGMLDVDADKQERLSDQLSPYFESVRRERAEFRMSLGRDDVQALVAMGPSAHHVTAEEVRRRLPDGELAITASVMVEAFRHATGG